MDINQLGPLLQNIAEMNIPVKIRSFPFEKEAEIAGFFESEFYPKGYLKIADPYKGPTSVTVEECLPLVTLEDWKNAVQIIATTSPVIFIDFWHLPDRIDILLSTTKKIFYANSTSSGFQQGIKEELAGILKDSKFPKIFSSNLQKHTLLFNQFDIYVVNAFSLEITLKNTNNSKKMIVPKPAEMKPENILAYAQNVISAALQLKATYGHTKSWVLNYYEAMKETLAVTCIFKREFVLCVHELILILCYLRYNVHERPQYSINTIIEIVLKTGKIVDIKNQLAELAFKEYIKLSRSEKFFSSSFVSSLPNPNSFTLWGPDSEICNKMDKEFNEFANIVKLTLSDYATRSNILQTVQEMIQSQFPKTQLYLFGSSVNGFGSQQADLDICLVDPKNQITLRQIQKILQSHQEPEFVYFSNVLPIPHAKVPILKFEVNFFSQIKYSGDISISNHLAIHNSSLIKTYSQVDPRVTPFMLVIKNWTKAHNINDASKGTLSSYAYVLMAINFLQLRGVVPNLQKLKEHHSSRKIYETWDCTYEDDLTQLEPSQNHDPVAMLVRDFFDYYSDFNFNSLVISIRTGIPFQRESSSFSKARLYVEDPFQLNHNLGRVVDDQGFTRIITKLREANKILDNAKPDESVLKKLLNKK